MASLATAASSVFDMVGQTSGAVVSAVNTVAGGMSMLNDFVTAQRVMQSKRLTLGTIEYDDVILENASLDALKREESIKSYVGSDSAKAVSYQAHHDRLKAALEAATKPAS